MKLLVVLVAVVLIVAMAGPVLGRVDVPLSTVPVLDPGDGPGPLFDPGDGPIVVLRSIVYTLGFLIP